MKASRPLIALLVVAVVFFALWTTVLRSSLTGSQQGHAAPLSSAIAAAHAAVNTSNAASVAHGGTVPQPAPAAPASTATRPQGAGTSGSTATTRAQTATTVRRTPPQAPSRARSRTAAGREHAVERALRTNEVIALLFYNSRGADDLAVRAELAGISVRGARILKLAVPLEELSRYPAVTNQVPVVQSPTLVLIDGSHRAHLLVGYTTGFELAQRITDALAGS